MKINASSVRGEYSRDKGFYNEIYPVQSREDVISNPGNISQISRLIDIADNISPYSDSLEQIDKSLDAAIDCLNASGPDLDYDGILDACKRYKEWKDGRPRV